MQKHVSHFENGFVQRHIPDAEGRVGSVDMCLFIHAVVTRHAEVVTLITRDKIETTR